ncbi:extensin family protein [Ruegeria sp. 6PALISEP08]|uniref:extensin-like domain-containing protein n=1 Tax=Ruegeria sp. 6PALISEP08 TaxID=1225660 RepID=UPI00067F6820|nr:extensin family protein [Ruegeria sp. 6PALISEP08]
MKQVCLTILFLCLNAGNANASPDCADSGEALEVSLPGTTTDAAPAAQTPEDLPPCATLQLEQGRDRMRERGAVCGDWTILGETRKALTSKARGCGIANPVRVYRISDVALSQFSLMDCQTAVTLKTWIENTAKPAFADLGGGLKGMRVVGHYACKTQNNQPRARLSQHARGRAIDISTFVLQDGTQITVQDGWNDSTQSAVLRQLHTGACGVFSTVLGPDADRYHAGHFHFDTAQRKGAPVCR